MTDDAPGFRSEPAEGRARSLYRADLPYHNFRHALDAVDSGRDIVARCRREGIRIDEEVVYYALLFHDAGYHEDHVRRGFEIKEAYSARLAAEALAALNVQTRVIDKVERAILSTYRFAGFVTAEEKAVRAADLAGLAADYETFRANTERLRAEHALLTGETVTWENWVRGVVEVLRYYLSQEIRLTSNFSNAAGESQFHQLAGANLARLTEELRGPLNPSGAP
jgi:predicted metal-dependent HD superfamily phosphohydrolase